MPKDSENKPNLRLIEGQGIKKKLCEYCGEHEHAAALACPRIASITYYADGEQMDVFFHIPVDMIFDFSDEDDEEDDSGPPAA